MTPFESIGLWFLPSEPEQKIAGTLRFSRDGGLILKLSGTFQTSWTLETAQYPIIHGAISDSPYGKFVSLFDCFATNLKVGMPGISLETIRANHGMVGNDLIQSEDVPFDEAAVYFSPLAGWLGYSGLTSEHSPEHDVIARWRKQEPLHADVPGGRISAEMNLCTSFHASTISLEERPWLSIKCHEPSTSEAIHRGFVAPLARLMVFASDNRSSLNEYKLFRVGTVENKIAQLDRIYNPIDQLSPEELEKKGRSHELLFRLRDVPHGFSSFIPAWFSFVHDHSDFCSMFFAYGYQDAGYLERRFLFRMLAAQLLAKEVYPDDPDVKALETLRQSFLDSIKVAKQPYATLVMPSAFQLAAPSLLARLFNDHWRIIKDVVKTDEEHFITTLFATLDHVTKLGKPVRGAVTGAKLVWLIERLSAVIKLCVLSRLGFSDDKMSNTITTNLSISSLMSFNEPWTP